MTVIELIQEFGTEEACLEYLEGVRWPDGVECPHCNGRHIKKLSTRREYQCNECRKQFSVTAGTIMHRSRLSLTKWVVAVHLIASAKKGISACQLQRHLGVQYRTAWTLLHRIRTAMKEDTLASKMAGTIEVDETYIGGKERGIGPGRPGKKSKKVPVMGLKKRGGQIRCEVVPDVSMPTVLDVIRRNVESGETVITDEYVSYRRVGQEYIHSCINHSIKYVDGEIHTNGVENFWSLLKRGIVGSYHHVSPKYLPLYLDEFVSRFNARDLENGDYVEKVLKGCVKSSNGQFADSDA